MNKKIFSHHHINVHVRIYGKPSKSLPVIYPVLISMVYNSLTLNKLRQKRMLEDRLAAKRALQMEKLEKKQSLEYQVSWIKRNSPWNIR